MKILFNYLILTQYEYIYKKYNVILIRFNCFIKKIYILKRKVMGPRKEKDV